MLANPDQACVASATIIRQAQATCAYRRAQGVTMSNRSQALAFASAFACLLSATEAGAVECAFFDVDADSSTDKACKVDYENGSEAVSMAG